MLTFVPDEGEWSSFIPGRFVSRYSCRPSKRI